MQRNGQNPIKAEKAVSHDGNAFKTGSAGGGKGPGGLHCPACDTEIPPKPGFRPSSLKCPKCGASLAKR